MRVDGREFVRNMAIEQDRERLSQEQQQLEESKKASVQHDEDYPNTGTRGDHDENAYVDLSVGSENPSNNHAGPSNEENVADIILETGNQKNKKKYMMLGMGLILLFILTVLIIRLISNNETENTLKNEQTQNTQMVKDDILNKIDSNEAYQKVLDQKNALEAAREREAAMQANDLNQLAISKEEVSNVPLVLDVPKPTQAPKRDLFELNEENTQQTAETKKEPVAEKVVPKRTAIVPPASETNFAKSSTEPSGYFVQIGAFTRDPAKTLIRDIELRGYAYTIYKITIKGKLYNKVLIGPYNQRADAIERLGKIKSDFKNPNAYILKL